MEPSSRTVEFLLGPAISYIPTSDLKALTLTRNPKDKNARDSSKPHSSWHLFRADFITSKISAIPKFALGHKPVRIEIHLHSSANRQEPWRSMRPSFASMTPGSGGSSALAEHILAALEVWSTNFDNFENTYMNMPFGSRINIEILAENVRDMQISFEANYELELQWRTHKHLQTMWKVQPDHLPPVIDLSELQLVTELHETVHLVTLRDNPSEKLVFKSTTGNPRFLYRELLLLLSVKPHPNIISRPVHIVTKKVNFGGKKGICGFLLEFHSGGTLATRITSKPANTINLGTKVRWAYQLASALAHVKTSSMGYYSDLKLDNIVLRESKNGEDAMLIDFEQRGSWASWSPPEINKLMLLVYLATRRSSYIPRAVGRKYRALLDRYLPSWRGHHPLGPGNGGGSPHTDVDPESDMDIGYNKSWRALSPDERDHAVVFMFGRILWCIFEGRASANAAEFFGGDVFREVDSEHRFPDFRYTPEHVQDLIRECTRGAPEWAGLKRCIRTVGNVVYDARSTMKEDVESEARAAVDTLRKWWSERIREARGYLVQRAVDLNACEDARVARTRPGIEHILESLRKYGDGTGFETAR
ncbi:uncharacterized protein N7446_010663 [Penicillium canescens]|uniref:uncharacterized protein n=1 Tax=Penicillium canescens TaxID=5083 RepID=UPI0026DFF557|nr:uncharacterized protein N7446_010663 [Penicillium canescens]KAJ6050554.1 hypothetical protein N7446_010663 [Penicillium canescens]